MKDNYHNLHDFILDPHFCNWVLKRDSEGGAYWQSYLDMYPEKAELLWRARAIVLASTANSGVYLEKAEKKQLWHAIQANATSAEGACFDVATSKSAATEMPPGWLKPALSVAACVAAVVMLSVVLFKVSPWNHDETVKYVTQYGEVKRVTLPDGSAVVLNANSVLTFDNNWQSSRDRVVRLTGEAFFKVTHQQNDQKFRVKLSDAAVVQVLGTEFTVTQRPYKSRVVLNEGKVKFAVVEETLMGLFSDTLAQETLQPGELVQLTGGQRALRKETTPKPEAFAAFQHNKLMFIDTPLSEVAKVLHATYGYDIYFSEPKMRSRRYTGTVPYDRVDLLFAALEKLYNIQIKQQGMQLKVI